MNNADNSQRDRWFFEIFCVLKKKRRTEKRTIALAQPARYMYYIPGEGAIYSGVTESGRRGGGEGAVTSPPPWRRGLNKPSGKNEKLRRENVGKRLNHTYIEK